MDSKIVNIGMFREAQTARKKSIEYKEKLKSMHKADLLCELLAFHDVMKESNDTDLLTTVKGLALMEVLIDRSLTPALQSLADGYAKKLKSRYDNLVTGEFVTNNDTTH